MKLFDTHLKLTCRRSSDGAKGLIVLAVAFPTAWKAAGVLFIHNPAKYRESIVRRSNRIAFLLVCLFSRFACPQVQHKTQPPGEAVQITLGESAVPLYGPWKFTVGDSPVDPATGQMLWARPDFDDSKWETVDLAPANGRVDVMRLGFSGTVKGWTDRGHRGYFGYAWYRIRVRVTNSNFRSPLALSGPSYVDDAYELFTDGTLLGSFGDFSGRYPKILASRPLFFNLPWNSAPLADSPSEHTLAFRVWMASFTGATQPDAGGMHTSPVIGTTGAVSAANHLGWLQLFRAYVSTMVEGSLFLLLAVIAFSLSRFDHSDLVYRWMGTIFLLIFLSSVIIIAEAFGQHLGALTGEFLIDVMVGPLIIGGWAVVWWIWFRLEHDWVPKAVALLTLAYMLSAAVGESFLYPYVSIHTAQWFSWSSIAVKLALFGLILFIVLWGIRRRSAGAWLVLPAVLLLMIGRFGFELQQLHIAVRYMIFGVRIGLSQISSLLMMVVLFILLFRRLRQSIQRQQELALDVKQAQEVQRVLLPETVRLPGLTIESDYRPAREVGGDFFQVIPNIEDGSVLIVVGDVAGKGLQAGMLVAMIVGTIRTATETSVEPINVLNALNRRLFGRGGANATCIALSIESTGEVTLVNAGGVPPYLNGKELPLEGAFPLGMIASPEFTVSYLKLGQGDSLMLISDGITEARNEEGELFGFGRVSALLQKRVSAAALASEAQSFGQEDDISAVTITCA
ncbi:PP2C family protein-serine/threonine phosphatase [Tunturiibacter psychrotolerans]|uniref:PP2C family protein-serine/threonine phosphatase n=1 Tax=Tunturiibacter psychrotolerans TaxID=3069686 RepID=UPI003D20EE8D